MQTTYPRIKTNRGRHHDIPGHTKTKIKLMVSNLSYAAACSSLDLHCKGRALRPSLQSPTLGIFRAAPPCRLRHQTTMGKTYGPTADGIRCCRPWHTTPPGIAPYATAMALHPWEGGIMLHPERGGGMEQAKNALWPSVFTLRLYGGVFQPLACMLRYSSISVNISKAGSSMS